MNTQPLRLRLLRQLVAIEDMGSIRRAAERLGVSQPALSKGIQEAERQLGVELLRRGRGGAVLTDLARDISRRGRQILLLSKEIERDIQQWPQTRTGNVRLGAGAGSLVPLMRRVVQSFLLEFPEVDVELYNRDPRELAKMLESGELDVLIAIDETIEDTDLLIRKPLRRETPLLFVRKGHPLDGKQPCSREDILQYRLAAPFLTRNLVNWANGSDAIVEKKFNHIICTDYNVLCEAVMHCDCVGICTEYMFEYLSADHDLRKLDVSEFSMQVMVCCIYRKTHGFSRSTLELISRIEKS